MRLFLTQLGWRGICLILITWMSVYFPNGACAADAKRMEVSKKAPAVHDSEHPPAGISQGAWGKIMAQISEDQYRISRDLSASDDNNVYRAVNPANGLRASFDQQGVGIKPLSKDKDWQLNLSLSAYGVEGSVKPVSPAEPKEVSEGLEYVHKGIRQWYKNDNRGLEQGFTIENPLEKGSSDQLMLILNTSGSLTPKESTSGNRIGFYDPSGNMALSYGDLKVVDADGKKLPAILRLARKKSSKVAGEIRISVDAIGARYPITIDPLLSTGEYKLTASDAGKDDNFGDSVAISGDTVVVGAPDNEDAGDDSGAAYIFSRNKGGADNWGEVRKLTASDATAHDLFGHSVSISGDTVVVGAIGDDDGGNGSGAAYIFSRNKGGADNWGEVRKLTASDPAGFLLFGDSVAISGDTVLVGVGGQAFFYGTGSAYIFSRNKGGADKWGEVRILHSDPAGDDYFGCSVAISGDTAVVGAKRDDDRGSDAGAAYIFSRNRGEADNWGQVRKLTASDAENFGDSVAISGDTVLVGADYSDDGGSGAGAAYIFSRKKGGVDNWGQVRKLTASDPADFLFFGDSVAISDDTAVVGDDAGAAYIFSRNKGGIDNWGEWRKLTASDAGISTNGFGQSVAVSE
jgi:hypothetical protein